MTSHIPLVLSRFQVKKNSIRGTRHTPSFVNDHAECGINTPQPMPPCDPFTALRHVLISQANAFDVTAVHICLQYNKTCATYHVTVTPYLMLCAVGLSSQRLSKFGIQVIGIVKDLLVGAPSQSWKVPKLSVDTTHATDKGKAEVTQLRWGCVQSPHGTMPNWLASGEVGWVHQARRQTMCPFRNRPIHCERGRERKPAQRNRLGECKWLPYDYSTSSHGY